MTEQKTVKLNVNEWKAICLQGVRDLHQFLDGMIYPSDEALSQVDQHMARWAVFMRSWKLHGEPQEPVKEPSGNAETKAEPVANGAEKKRRGGWPRGKPRKPKAEAQATVQ